jgi:hypothetical protein
MSSAAGGGHGAEPAGGTRWRSPTDPCANCGDPTPGRFCPTCGQRRTTVRVSVGAIVGEVIRDELALNSALPRTLVGILLQPGRLTNEYIRGRVVSYIPPLRLYLISSVLFFLLLSFVGLRALDRPAPVMLDGAPSADAAADDDSVRAVLQAQREQLASLDTAGLPVMARSFVRRAIAETDAALAGAGDTTAEQTRARRALPDAVALPPGTMQPWAADMRRSARGAPLQHAVERKLDQLGHLPPEDAIREFLSSMLDFAPHAMFVLLPVFALLLKLLYIRRDRYYAEHFVFALHVHSFFFLMFIIMLALPWDRADGLLIIWMVVYVWLAMKRVYRQGLVRTTAKWLALAWSYVFLLAFGLLGLVFSTLFIG